MAAGSSSLAAPPLDEVAATRRVCAEGPAAAAARAERLRGEAAVTAAGVLPNPSLSVQHQRTLSGPGESETVVGLSVPLGLGGQRFVLQDAARAKATAARLGILEAGVAEIERAVVEAAALESQAGRLYAAGEASIAELLDALRAAEEAQLARIDLREEIALTRLAWMRATGTMLDATLDHACGDAAGGTR
jgi:outer membrane protein TolC